MTETIQTASNTTAKPAVATERGMVIEQRFDSRGNLYWIVMHGDTVIDTFSNFADAYSILCSLVRARTERRSEGTASVQPRFRPTDLDEFDF